MDNDKNSERDSQSYTPPGYNPEDDPTRDSNPLFPDPRERNEIPTTSQPVDVSKVKVEVTDQPKQENRPFCTAPESTISILRASRGSYAPANPTSL